MIATFEENEEQLLDKIKSMLGTTQYESFDFDSALYFEHGLVIYPQNRKVCVNELELSFSKNDYELLLFFALHPRLIFTKEHLFNALWHMDSDSCFSAVVNTICRLRKKLEPDPQHPIFIQTIPGYGYKFSSKQT